MTYWSNILHMDVRATPVMGPLVSGDLMTSRKGPRYFSGSTAAQSAGARLQRLLAGARWSPGAQR